MLKLPNIYSSNNFDHRDVYKMLKKRKPINNLKDAINKI
jgi:hypothetical protein